ncbi:MULTISPECIES: hypothetical protein [Cohnella]|uniref:hypothetical protein n=1 Tax=Cohnella TaxID=329857 RepID=UPI0009BB8172|nr:MULTISPECIES: hypothetical protein [Cohnella]MBN2984927.1 hypothetical protein [Cohnella algarum]
MNTVSYPLNHSIVTEAAWYNPVEYDISNISLLAQFDGNGGVSKYSVAGQWSLLTEKSWFAAWSVNGKRLPYRHRKRIEVLGRGMEIDYLSAEELDGVSVRVKQYSGNERNALYICFEFENQGSEPARILLRHGMQWDLKGYMSAMVEKHGSYHATKMKEAWNELRTVWEAEFGADYSVRLASSHRAERIEQEGPRMVLDFVDLARPGQKVVFTLGITGGMEPLASDELAEGAAADWEAAESYRSWLKESFSANGQETLNSLVAACLNVSHSSYKVSGKKFAAFYAGVNYQSPSRTYFRDGYWTLLPLLPFKPEWVRNEIVTLAHAISNDGSCPSAVIYNVLRDRFEQFWPDHYDSPSFFVMMLHDYLAWTHDKGLLAETVNGRTLLEWAGLCMEKLNGIIERELQLLVKPDNRRDWCDNVVRQGAVAYDSLLYLRARQCFAEIMVYAEKWTASGDNVSTEREIWDANTTSLTVKLHERLWDDAVGYRNYENIGGEGKQENNISVEQALAPVYGIGAEQDQQRILDLLTANLETRNNDEQPYGDWGVMTVFPQYSNVEHLVEKSAYPLRYHNGSDWPYWSGILAWAKLRLSRKDWEYPLTRWFTYGLERQWLTPVEYYDPVYGKGSDLQGWSGMPAAAVLYGGLGLMPPLNGNIVPIAPPWGETCVAGIRYRGETYDYSAKDGVVRFVKRNISDV